MSNKKQLFSNLTEVTVRIPVEPSIAAVLVYLSQNGMDKMEVNLEDISPLGITVVATGLVNHDIEGRTPEERDLLYEDAWDAYWEDDEEELLF